MKKHYLPVIPRPGRIVHSLNASFQSASINHERLSAILENYGTSFRGQPSYLHYGWRNQNTLVNTPAGKKVLRLYRKKWRISEILHEHSILQYLAEYNFPAPRLNPTRSGETVAVVDGRYYALFDFIPGDCYAACYLPTSQYMKLVSVAGSLLARYHRLCQEFYPIGAHHLALKTPRTNPTLDISWLGRTLDDLTEKTLPLLDTRYAANARWLIKNRSFFEEAYRLSVDILNMASPQQTVIHGDFGLHNLLFDASGNATPLDFELARVEWRLRDLVEVIAHGNPEPTRQFLIAYMSEYPIPAEELRHMPDFWRLIMLEQGLVDWKACFDKGKPHRLASARLAILQAGVPVDIIRYVSSVEGRTGAAPGTPWLEPSLDGVETGAGRYSLD